MKIEDICTRICSGGTPKSGKAEYYENGTIPWLNTKEINFNRIQATETFITEEGLNNSSAKWIKPHAVIVAMYGATAGRVAVAETPLTTNQACCNLEVDETIADYRYIYYWLKQNFDSISGLANGGAQQNLSAKVIRQIEINLPDLIKQRSIANFLDSFDSKIETNAKLNGYLGEQCEAIASHEKGHIVELASLCDLVKDKADYSEANFDTYVSTESLLPGKMGRQAPSSLPQAGKITVYKVGDILVSNIRPYFKKIWYADQAGTCSGDVLVFRAKQPEQSGYLYSRMRSDAFFDYAMKGAKGTKMPRGDKKQMLTYKVGGNPNGATIDFIESALNQASSISKENRKLATLRDALLPKLISGEIDVSKVDLTRLNSHLAKCFMFIMVSLSIC